MTLSKTTLAVLVVAMATIVVPGAFAQSTKSQRILPHRPFKDMSLDQRIAYQNKAVRHHQHVVRTFLVWRKHHKNLAATLEEIDLPRCKALGIIAPENVCWAAQAKRWTKKELDENLARKKAREVARARAEAERRAAAIRSSMGSVDAWACIHSYEGAWTSNTGNGYYGGLQMDYGFMRSYGPELLSSKGTADKWTPQEQMMVAQRAHDGYAGHSARGYGPWPNTARACRLL